MHYTNSLDVESRSRCYFLQRVRITNPNPWQASGRAIGTLMDYLKQHLPFSVTSSLNTSYFPSPILHHRKMSQEGFRTI
jgi:hypothetical protein